MRGCGGGRESDHDEMGRDDLDHGCEDRNESVVHEMSNTQKGIH